MSSEKTLAIVLRVVDFSETSCVVTLFTRDFGKIGALAKGARRPKSPFESALDLLALCRIVFLHKSSDTLDLLTEARLERRFRSATHDLSRLYAGYYVAELLRELTDTDDPHPELFDAADRVLWELDGDQPAAALVLYWEMTALRVLGHMPSLTECAACGGPVTASAAGRVAFGLHSGGVLCGGCRPGQRNVIGVTEQALRVMQQYGHGDETPWRQGELDARCRGEIRAVMTQYISQLLGHRPQMHSYLGAIAERRGSG